jgi:hypothetical protein
MREPVMTMSAPGAFGTAGTLLAGGVTAGSAEAAALSGDPSGASCASAGAPHIVKAPPNIVVVISLLSVGIGALHPV